MKERSGLEDIVLVIPGERPMKLVGAAAKRRVDDGTAGATVFAGACAVTVHV